MGQRTRAFGAVVVGVGLIAAACGGDDDTSSSAPTAADVTAADTATTATTTGSESTTPATTGPQPTSMQEWEALWAKEREAIVSRAKEEGLGKSADGKTLNGPGGLTVDLGACPTGWSDTEGLTDTEIKFGETGAASGTLADSYSYYKAINALFDHYNEQGAFKDSTGKTRTINYIFKDDSYDPAKTIPLVDELIDSEKVFAIETLGTPNTMKVYDKLNERCIPHPWAITAHPAWNDPVNHPWTTGLALTYSTEAILWGSFIEDHAEEFGDDITVAALVMNNDFGKVYDATFKAYIEQSEFKDQIDYVTETIEPAAATVTNEMTTLASKDPDVFIMMLAGTACAQSVVEASQNGMKESAKYLFVGQPCGNNATMGRDKVGGDGSAADGWYLVGGGARDMTDPSQAELPFVKFMAELLESKGIDPKSSGNLNSGTFFAWPLVQAFIIGGQLEGGLTRTNFMMAQRMMVMTDPFVFEGVKFTTNGVEDAFPIEGGVYQQYSAEKQAFERRSDIIDLDGKSTPCAWDQSDSTCK
jgi:branched-chain amino acid transport system substrate-binding protein